MSRVVVIGGSGHIGTYLVPRLVGAGHDVINVSRGEHGPYQSHGAWNFVRKLALDRDTEEKSGAFGEKNRSGGLLPRRARALSTAWRLEFRPQVGPAAQITLQWTNVLTKNPLSRILHGRYVL